MSNIDFNFNGELGEHKSSVSEEKVICASDQIEKYLKSKGAKNYWVNTTGFIRLFMDLG